MELQLLAMVSFAFVGAISPGPVNLIASHSAAQYGIRPAFQHVMGASIAYALVVLISGLLLQSIGKLLPQIAIYMQIGASLFLLYLAYQILRSTHRTQSNQLTKTPNMTSGAALQLLNPKAWLVAMSGASLFVINAAQPRQALLVFSLVSLVICVLGVGSWAGAGHLIGKYLQSVRQQLIFNLSMAALLCASVLNMWIS
ncbi:LysE family translocator [Alginatibacterium sediminis]|uniref:LysE family translocator n=1 Tax=Alginatibacterium sediminis TaxID=2164068 RepID=A0A420EN92_9ALTE|nr:LysE family translocator [Alginatibacterium sediminis]RKF22121.1 LysE family translocator [Alginatibacterium sediminis]